MGVGCFIKEIDRTLTLNSSLGLISQEAGLISRAEMGMNSARYPEGKIQRDSHSGARPALAEPGGRAP